MRAFRILRTQAHGQGVTVDFDLDGKRQSGFLEDGVIYAEDANNYDARTGKVVGRAESLTAVECQRAWLSAVGPGPHSFYAATQ